MLKNKYINTSDIMLAYEKFRGKRTLILLNKLLNIFFKNKRIESLWTPDKFNDTVHWGAIKYIEERNNYFISGSKYNSFGKYIINKYIKPKSPDAIGLTLGCGMGYREIELAESGCFMHIDSYDLSESALDEARRIANNKFLDNILYFEKKDINKYELPKNYYDIILVEQSLHHFSPLEPLMKKINNSLKSDGLFIINEYVGPDKFQWTEKQLNIANGLLAILPDRYKIQSYNKKIKRQICRPGLVRMKIYDPSEAVESSRIVPIAKNIFEIIEDVNYGGTVISLLFQDIANNFNEEDETAQKLLKIVTELEDCMINYGEINSDYKFLVCKKKIV